MKKPNTAKFAPALKRLYVNIFELLQQEYHAIKITALKLPQKFCLHILLIKTVYKNE